MSYSEFMQANGVNSLPKESNFTTIRPCERSLCCDLAVLIQDEGLTATCLQIHLSNDGIIGCALRDIEDHRFGCPIVLFRLIYEL